MKTRPKRIFCGQVYSIRKVKGVLRQEGTTPTAMHICRENELYWKCSCSLSQCLFCCFNKIFSQKQLKGDFKLKAIIVGKSRQQEWEVVGHMTSTGMSREKSMHAFEVLNSISLLIEPRVSTPQNSATHL